MAIIEVKHLTKEYKLGALTGIKDSFRQGLAKITGRETWQRERFKALDDVNFSIEEGEVVGIIGHNGAGKSTLLKHLANITNPTRGEVHVRGSVAPLIEVGAGLNPELTGRENIYLNGAILGIPRKKIKEKLDEIIDFSELEQFIDTPVKRYSSGMTVKLGFSIATSMDADILVVDEVLAVGDLAFQRKCFDRMEELIKRQGKTILLVSHNIRQVERMCERVILMNQGVMAADGRPKEICTRFYSENDEKIKLQTAKVGGARREMTGGVEVKQIELLDKSGRGVEDVDYADSLIIRLTIVTSIVLNKPYFGIGVHTTDFLYLATENTDDLFQEKTLYPGTHVIEMKVSSFPFLPGAYSIRVGIGGGDISKPLFYEESMFTFLVKMPGRHIRSTMKEGFVSLSPEWTLVG